MMYKIFDSMDRACSDTAPSESDLHDELKRLQEEAEEDDLRLTYAIGLVRNDGQVTYEF